MSNPQSALLNTLQDLRVNVYRSNIFFFLSSFVSCLANYYKNRDKLCQQLL